MLIKHLSRLKDISQTQLEQSQLQLKDFIQKYNNHLDQLKKNFILHKRYKNMLYKKLKLGLNALTLNTYYMSLEVTEKRIFSYNKIIHQDLTNIQNKKNILKKLYKKLKIWNILYNRIMMRKKHHQQYLLRRDLDQYYQWFALKKYFL